MKELNQIQTRLVATKNQKNNFGNYNYRNLEGILESLKPLLSELECTITFSDELVLLGDRIFCKSTAVLKNKDGESETSTSFAELDNHKGMSKEQSSGSSSSYARKYAICSLLAIDDNQDPDSMDNRDDNKAPQQTFKTIDVDRVIEEMKAYCRLKYTEFNNGDAPMKAARVKEFVPYYERKLRSGEWQGPFNTEKLLNNWLNK